MTTVVTRQMVHDEIERYAMGETSGKEIAAWAFDQFYDQCEGVVSYESGYRRVIDTVLEKLMWADTDSFALDLDEARRLQRELAAAQPVHDEDWDAEDDEDDEDD
jgi:hypothetical protein